jgi:hypothetical protein
MPKPDLTQPDHWLLLVAVAVVVVAVPAGSCDPTMVTDPIMAKNKKQFTNAFEDPMDNIIGIRTFTGGRRELERSALVVWRRRGK